MRLKVLSHDSLDDGWNEPAVVPLSFSSSRSRSMSAGDAVLCRVDGLLTPAVLVEAAGSGCWLARDARGLLYLGAEHIKTRLPQMDLLEEAA